MGSPLSLLNQARAFARDYARDQMPRGFLWDVVDFVPLIIDAPLTGRGAWQWGSEMSGGGDFETGLLMPFASGDQLLASTDAGALYNVGLNPTYPLTPRGAVPLSIQNPIRFKDVAVQFDKSGATVPTLWRVGDTVASHASFKNAKVGTVYKAMVVSAGGLGEENLVRFSHPNTDLTAPEAYDANSFIIASQPVTALAALRAVVLVFHAGSVERIRGATPPHGDVEKGDMFLENLFDRAGCQDPRSIAYWNDNCIFADEHGVHLTDGAIVRNLASQGGILYYWRNLFAGKVSVAACTFLDYYLITVRRSVGPPITLVCDLNRKQWFRFSNVDALTYFASGGSTGMERIWAGMAGTQRLARMGPCFFPVFDSATIVDANGVTVLPSFETPWYRIAVEGRKRVRFVYLSYDVRNTPLVAADGQPSEWRGRVLGEHIESGVQVLEAPAPHVATSMVDVGYITSPQQPAYVSAGQLPATSDYTRYRLPVNKFPYGIGFKVTQTVPGTVFRIFDLGVEAQAVERSRV